MNTGRILTLALAAVAIVATPARAGTPNTTAAGAVSYEVGQGWVTHAIDEAAQDRWFAFREVAGRSYCVEAGVGVATYFPLDPNLTLYTDTAGTTQLATNADGASEPGMNKGARICYASPQTLTTTSPATSTVRAFKVNVPITGGSGDSGFVRVRVVETTLIAERVNATNWDYRINNSGTTTVTGAFYIPGVGKSSDITITAERRGSAAMSTVFGSVISSRPVYFMHNGTASSLEGSLVKTDAGGFITDEAVFLHRRD